MYYTEKNKSETSGGRAVEVKEPVAAYYTGKIGNAAEPWEADSGGDRDDDGIDWDAIGAPESITVNSYEELCRKLEEAEEDERAGRVRPFDEAMRDFWRRVENGEL